MHTRFKPFTYFSVQSCCVSAWPHSLPIHCVKFQFAESYYGSVECPEEKCCMKYKLGDTGKEQEMCQKEIFFFFYAYNPFLSFYSLCLFFQHSLLFVIYACFLSACLFFLFLSFRVFRKSGKGPALLPQGKETFLHCLLHFSSLGNYSLFWVFSVVWVCRLLCLGLASVVTTKGDFIKSDNKVGQ